MLFLLCSSSEELQEHIRHDKLTPVIFSHGLGGCRHTYSSICCQLASRGCLVISMDHMDEVSNILRDIDIKAPIFLQRRVNEIKTVIDEINTGSGSISELFGTKLEIDMSRLTLIGHSYGGVSSYVTSSEDNRVKNCIMLDPWLAPVPFENLDKKLTCNTLLFESEDWNDKYPDARITLSNTKVMEAQVNGDHGAIYCKVPESQHSHFCDDILLSGSMLKYLKFLKDDVAAERVLRSSIIAIDDYFSIVISRNQNSMRFASLYDGDKRFPFKIYS